MSAVFVKVHKIILDLPAFQRLSSTGPQGKKQIFLIPSVLKMKMLFCKFEFVSGSFCVPLLVHSELVCICVYEKVSDVPESKVWFASKNLTPSRMHYNDFLICQIIAKCHSFPNMYDML